MQRNPVDQFLKDPDNRAKAYLFYAAASILTTIVIVIGALLFIIYTIF